MKLVFFGMENSIEITPGRVAVLEVHNRVLFARICESLASGLEEYSIEPFTIWDSVGKRVSASSQMIVIASPVQLPWDDRRLLGSLPVKMEALIFEEPDKRLEFESLFAYMTGGLQSVALQLQSDYCFTREWDVKRFLKSFDFQVDYDNDDRLFDKLIKFLLLSSDVARDKVLVFFNLKDFLSPNEYETFLDQVFFLGLMVLLIERDADESSFDKEEKTVIDQDLLES